MWRLSLDFNFFYPKVIYVEQKKLKNEIQECKDFGMMLIWFPNISAGE